MARPDPKVASAQAAKPQSFKSRYKLHGVIFSVLAMWIDFALIHHGLTANDPAIVSGGLMVMIAAVALAYYFG